MCLTWSSNAFIYFKRNSPCPLFHNLLLFLCCLLYLSDVSRLSLSAYLFIKTSRRFCIFWFYCQLLCVCILILCLLVIPIPWPPFLLPSAYIALDFSLQSRFLPFLLISSCYWNLSSLSVVSAKSWVFHALDDELNSVGLKLLLV